MGSIERIMAVADRVMETFNAGNQVIVVLSAMAGETDRLISLAREVSPNPDPREMDVLISTGEQVSIALLSITLQSRGYLAKSFTGSQVSVHTDSVHNKARIEKIDTQNIQQALDKGQIVVVAGFQGKDNEGDITTLGRGGSDTSAVALAAAMKADECRIYTDVDGVYTADPRIVPDARRMACISYEEMLEMASLGSKVLQIRSVEFANKYKVPLRVLSSFNPGDGTLIIDEDEEMEQA